MAKGEANQGPKNGISDDHLIDAARLVVDALAGRGARVEDVSWNRSSQQNMD